MPLTVEEELQKALEKSVEEKRRLLRRLESA